MSLYTLHHGDSREVMRGMGEASVDSIVTDPPYELGFMGKGWDSTGVANDPALWREALRVLKPGGHLLAFSGTRTYHRMVCAIEDAGFAVRDQLAWVYGSGFPKSHNGEWGGTALKPAWEPIVMARKPLIGTVEANWREHGTGALNIEGCRIGTTKDVPASASTTPNNVYGAGMTSMTGGTETSGFDPNVGRWPANLVHDGSDEVLQVFPYAPGQQAAESFTAPSSKTSNVYGERGRRPGGFGNVGADSGSPVPNGSTYLDGGGSAARFFYCAKAAGEDRNEGLRGFAKAMPTAPNGAENAVGAKRGSKSGPRANHHPTVKPTDLMRWLVRLVTPAGGLVLDPFMGSGSTGKAALLEGMRFVGVDLTAEYIDIARARIEHARAMGFQHDLMAAA